MALLSTRTLGRVAPLAAAGVAGIAGAVIARRRRARLSIEAGPPEGGATSPSEVPEPPVPPAAAPSTAPPKPSPPATSPPSADQAPAPAEPRAPAPAEPSAPEAPAPAKAPAPPAPTPDEAALADAVRSALAEAAGEQAGGIEVEAAGALVVLRGRVDSAETIRNAERAAGDVAGVEGVRVLLHLPGRRSR